MGRCTRPTVTRHRIAAGLLALCIAGCGGNSNVQLSSGSSFPSQAGALSFYGTTTFSSLLSIGILGAVLSGGYYHAAEMEPSRRILEQDCSKPIEDWSANLKCK